LYTNQLQWRHQMPPEGSLKLWNLVQQCPFMQYYILQSGNKEKPRANGQVAHSRRLTSEVVIFLEFTHVHQVLALP
jgi:hypothetical protein